MTVAKIIKKLVKLLFLLLLAIPIIPVALWGILQLPSIQEFGMNKVITWMNEETGSKIEYSSARFTGVNRINFNNLLVLHPNGDTIVYSKDASAAIAALYQFFFKVEPRFAVIRKLQFDQSDFNLAIDSVGDINLKFFIDYLEKGIDTTDTTHSGKPFIIKSIQITNSRFTLRDARNEIVTKGVNVGDMCLNNLNIDVKNLTIIRDTVHMDINLLSFIEKSGFVVNKMSAIFDLCNKHLFFDDVHILTPGSDINAGMIHMSFNKFKEYGIETLYDKIIFGFKFEDSKVNVSDIGYFVDYFWEDNQEFDFSGSFHGPLSHFKGNDFSIGWGQSSLLAGKFGLDGLPHVNKMFLIFDFKNLTTNAEDIKSLNLPQGLKIKVPEQLQKFTKISYQGNFTGYFNDFVSKGHLSTNLGDIFTDIMILPDSLNQINFSGKITSKDFQIGAILGKEDFVGGIDIIANVRGVFSEKKPLKASLNGNIDKFYLNDYLYKNIAINGSVSDNKLVTNFEVQDPNLRMEFDGLFNLASDKRLFKFKANVMDASLYALNISKSDPEYHLSFLAEADLQGNSIDSINGSLKLINSFFSKSDKQIQIYDLELNVRNGVDRNELDLHSDILNADFSGKFKLSELQRSFINYLSCYIPAITKKECNSYTDLSNTELRFNADFKQTKSFFEFFFPNYLIADSTRISGKFVTGKMNHFEADIFSPEFIYKTNSLRGLVLNIRSDDNVIYADIGSQNLNINNRFNLHNYSLVTSTSKNKIEFKTKWLNWDTLLYKGNISGNLFFKTSDSSDVYLFSLYPSEIIVNDSIWDLSACNVIFESDRVGISDFSIQHENEIIKAHGQLSDEPGDSLYFDFLNFDLANLNYFTRRQDVIFKGNLDGGGLLTGIKNPLFFTSLTVDDLVINDEDLGFCSLNNIWNNEKQSLTIDASGKRGELTVFSIAGDYFPELNGKMDFQISLNKLKMDIFNPFLKGIFSDIRGLVSGDIQLTGVSGKPLLSGKLKLQKNAFTIDYLKTRYNFSSDLDIVSNNFIFDKIEVFDQFGNSAVINGMIRTEFLKELNLSLNITANNLLSLNTKATDNTMYYGTAFSKGNIRIKGKPSDLHFDIEAKTGGDTHFYIPLSDNSELSDFDFVKFIRNDSSDNEEVNKTYQFKTDVSGIQMNFNLDVTPEAEVQIIFDSKLGDIIKARGRGKMQMSINTLGTFDLVGEYIIDQGDYLFTLQNVINKKFEILSGSSIHWSGDPLNAQVEITATYRKKVNLRPLFPNEEEMHGNATVDCQIFLTGSLLKPNIKYGINLPYAQEDVKEKVKSKISSDEILTKQILSILIMNQFYVENSNESFSGSQLAGVNASELLSNQLSNWLSQISNDFDIGFNYKPGTGSGDDISSSEVELALSTQLFNDRLSINGSVDMKSNSTQGQTNKVVGDFDIDYKLNKSGNLRARAYNRPNDEQSQTPMAYTQGMGVFYMEEFSSFSELMNKYWSYITGTRKKKQTKETDIDKK